MPSNLTRAQIQLLCRVGSAGDGYRLFGAEHQSAAALERRGLGKVERNLGRWRIMDARLSLTGKGRRVYSAIASQPGMLERR